jgi:hypothetical protein
VLTPATTVVTLEIVTLELPVFVNFTVAESLLPSVTLPKLSLVALAEMVALPAIPVPLAGTATLEKLPVIVAEPVTAPADFGAKTRVRFAVVPMPRDSGSFSPLTENPMPAAVTVEMVSAAVPAFFSWIVCEFVVPTGTLPKLALAGTAETFADVPPDEAAPDPFIHNTTSLFAALLKNVIAPESAPATVGANFTVKVSDWPTAIVTGSLNPAMVNDGDEIYLSLLKTMGALPVFFIVTAIETEVPTLTWPNCTVFGARTSRPCVAARAGCAWKARNANKSIAPAIKWNDA